MLEFLRKLFAGTRRAGDRRGSVRPMLETFEARDLPSAGGLFATSHHLAAPSQAHFGAAVAGASANQSQTPDACGADRQTQTLTATLSGASGTSGSATFTSNTATGDNSLHVQVSGLNPNATYSVMSGTTALGTITTDANGAGKLSANNLSPALTAGAALTVLDSQNATVLSGTLAVASGHTDMALSASLTGATGTAGTAHFHADATTGQNSFRLRVSGLAANATYDVQVDGTTVGQITTDANGRGRLTLSNLSTTITAGSVVTVLDAQGMTILQGTFAADASSQGSRHHH
jgi:hypothetical protein